MHALRFISSLENKMTNVIFKQMQALPCTHIQDIATCRVSKFYCYLQSRYRGGQYEVMNLSLFEAVKTEISTIALFHFFLYLACSQSLYLKVRGAHVIKNKKQGGFIDRQRKGVGVGEVENRRSLFFVLARALRSPMFSKRTKSKKNNVWEQAILYSKGNLK